MRIMGIDPGYGIVGYGVVEYNRGKFTPVNAGTITTKSDMEFFKRLRVIYLDMQQLIEHYRPDEIAVEKLYFNTNITTGIDVAQARGVIMLAAAQRDIPVFEYTPLQVKVAVTGYGRAEKRQMQEMTKNILHLKEVPKPDDTADALAIAICHGHTGGSKLSEIMRENKAHR